MGRNRPKGNTDIGMSRRDDVDITIRHYTPNNITEVKAGFNALKHDALTVHFESMQGERSKDGYWWLRIGDHQFEVRSKRPIEVIHIGDMGDA